MAPLVNYLTSSDLEVHRTTAAALHQLSKVHCAFKVHKKLTRLTGEVDYDVSMTTNFSGSLELCDNAPVGCGHTSAEAHRVRRRGCSGLSLMTRIFLCQHFVRRPPQTVSRISGNLLWHARSLDTNISSHEDFFSFEFLWLLLDRWLVLFMFLKLFVQNIPFSWLSGSGGGYHLCSTCSTYGRIHLK